MKRFSVILLVFILLTGTACSAQKSDSAQDNAQNDVQNSAQSTEDDSAGNFEIGGNNAKVREQLKEINDNWVLNKKYIVEAQTINDRPAEWLSAKDKAPQKAILQLHGGAYIRDISFSAPLYSRMAEKYADISGAAVLTVDYRVAPEHPYPAALEDAFAAYQWLLDQGYTGEDILIAGDSAGGGLALVLILYLRDNNLPLPAAVLTMSAWAKLDLWITPAYIGKNDPKIPYISPCYGDYTGFPPMLMQVGTRDIQRGTRLVAENAQSANVDITMTTYQGMVHVFQALFPVYEKSCLAWDEAESFISRIFC